LKIQVEIAVEHGVLFLSDPYSDEEVPPDTGAAVVTTTPACIAFQVADYASGDAKVILADHAPADASTPDFRGSLRTDSSIIALSDSRRFNYCFVPVEGPAARLAIWASYDGDGSVWVYVENSDLF
jgi:hypothetical protein